MSQRDSGYERRERDLYETPEWATAALLPHLPKCAWLWEPACGSGKMARVLAPNTILKCSDIEPTMEGAERFDFLSTSPKMIVSDAPRGGIVTNPPYEFALEFCEHALRFTERSSGVVAMLLRTDFDHAKSRSHLFRDCPAFAKKVVLTKRIMWFEPEPGAKGKSPSFNHAWFIWDWKHEGAPTLAYGP